MRDAKIGKRQSMETIIARSKTCNATGIFRVYIRKNKSCKQGWNYCYNYTENGKRKALHSIDIHKLKQKVISKGLDWIILDETKANKILNET